MIDQLFLKEQIYSLIINDCLIHSSFGNFSYEKCVKPFPIKYCKNYYFVGGYVYADDSVSNEHIDILKKTYK